MVESRKIKRIPRPLLSPSSFNFKIMDKVIIVNRWPTELDKKLNWNPVLDETIGLKGEVIRISNIGIISVDFSDRGYGFGRVHDYMPHSLKLINEN